MARQDELLLDVVRKNRLEAVDLSTRIGQRRLARLLEKADADLTRRLAAATRAGGGPGKGSFTHEQLNATLRQVRDVAKGLSRGLGRLVVEQGREAADRSTEHLVEYLGRAEKAFRGVGARPLALKEAAILERAYSGTESTILRRLMSTGEEPGEAPHPAKLGILERYGAEVVGRFEESMQLGLVARKSWQEVRADLVADSPFLQGAPKHWAERIVRTESMHAYNRAAWEGMQEANEQLGDMVKILAATFDDRTSWDSYQVHGQIRRNSEPFGWYKGLYMHPPNRPNDRETVVPHRVSWPIPPQLSWRTDEQVRARWAAEGRKGSPPPRPRMTTIPLERFGQG